MFDLEARMFTGDDEAFALLRLQSASVQLLF